MKTIFLFFIIFLFSSFSLSQQRTFTGRKSNNKPSVASSTNNITFISFSYTQSIMKSNSIISERKMEDLGLSLLLKKNISKINLGLYYDYILNAQKEFSDNLNNTNMSSISSGFGALIGCKISDSFNLDLFYNIDYSIKTINKNSNNQNLLFKNKLGYKILLSYQINSNWELGTLYFSQDSESSGFSENLKNSGLGLVISYGLF